MDEDELERIREQKRKELEDQEQTREEALEDQKNEVRQQASQYLTKDAKERLGNIRVAQPDIASSIEMQIARLGKSGQIKKVTDDQLKDILQSFQNEKDKNSSDIKFRR